MEPTVLFYESPDGSLKIEAKVKDGDIWLTQDQIASLYNKGRSTIAEHIINIYRSDELDVDTCCRLFGKNNGFGKEIGIKYYNLETIISVGYRINSERGREFRKWATIKLKDYILTGSLVDEHRMNSHEDIDGVKIMINYV